MAKGYEALADRIEDLKIERHPQITPGRAPMPLPQLLDSIHRRVSAYGLVASFAWRATGMSSRYEELKAIAEECRRLAASIEDKAIQLRLLTVAQHFDLLANPHQAWDIVAAFRPKRVC